MCNSCKTVSNLKGINDGVDLLPMEEEYDLSKPFFFNPSTFDQVFIEKITKNLNMKKYLTKDTKTAVFIGHDSRSNYGGFMIESVLETHPE